MKHLSLLAFFVLLFAKHHAQIATGTWRMHTATMRALDIASNENTVFVAYENGLLRYERDSKEKTVLNKLNGLSDIYCRAYIMIPWEKPSMWGIKTGI